MTLNYATKSKLPPAQNSVRFRQRLYVLFMEFCEACSEFNAGNDRIAKTSNTCAISTNTVASKTVHEDKLSC